MHDDEAHDLEERPPPPTDAPDNTSTNGHRDVVDRSGEHLGLPGRHDIDAERSIAGAMLLAGNDTVDKVKNTGLEPADILDPTSCAVVAACYELHEAGVPVDVLTVADELSDAVTALQVPGGDGITSHGKAALLSLVAQCMSPASAPAHARIVIDHARDRHLKYAVTDLAEAHRLDDPARLDRALRQIVDLRTPAAGAELLDVHWVHETLEEPPPPDDDLIAGVLARGEITGIGANRNIGKSMLVMNMSILGARGAGMFLGAHPIRERFTTLLAHGETNRKGARRRWHYLTGSYQPDEGIGETFDPWRLRVVERRTTTLHAGGSTSDRSYDVAIDGRLEHTIGAHGIDVLVIDPWRVFYAGNENDSDQVEAALEKLRHLAVTMNIAVVIVHHLRGGTDGDATDPEDAWRGSTRLPDAVDTRITLLPHYTRKQAKDQGMTRKQSRRYQDVYFLRRGGPAPDDISIAWNPQTGWWERWRTAQEIGAELGGRPPAAHYNPIDLVDVLREIGGSWPSIRKAADDLGLSSAGATTLLERAVAAGHIQEYDAGRGRGFRLPEAADPTLQEGTDDRLI